MAKQSALQQRIPVTTKPETAPEFPPKEFLDGAVNWIRTLKAEGVSADTAAQSFVQILQTAMSAGPGLHLGMSEEDDDCQY